MNVPTLTTERLRLRPFAESDLDAMHRLLSEEGILRYFPNPDPPSRERVEQLIHRQIEHWETHGFGWWVVELLGAPGGGPSAAPDTAQDATHAPAPGQSPTPELLGWNGLLYLPETDEIEVDFLLGHAYWGKGYATEGARASLRFGFRDLGLTTIVALAHPDNTASRRVMEKLGMRFVERTRYFNMDVCKYMLESGTAVH
jgi:RimJ/RimL family protein N-acetyltransferase